MLLGVKGTSRDGVSGTEEGKGALSLWVSGAELMAQRGFVSQGAEILGSLRAW